MRKEMFKNNNHLLKKKSLPKRNAADQEYLSHVAHALRNPLATIQGYLQLLIKRTEDKTPQAGWLQEAYKESRNLDKLIDNMLSSKHK